MNVLALYDIHGNVDALEAVLADERALGPDVVVVGGDAVPGPFAEATLARLDALGAPVRWVRGNGEREVAEAMLDGVLFGHASPRRDDEMLTRLSTVERWAEALEGAGAGLVVAGHTHQQDDRAVGPVRFVNAGSVGLPYEGDGAARWLWIADGVPELRSTAYDAAGAGGSSRRAGPTSGPSGPRSSIRSSRSS